MSTPTLIALAAAVALGTPLAAQFQNPWKVGEPLPDLQLPTIDGKTFSFAELRGKKFLLIEFASW